VGDDSLCRPLQSRYSQQCGARRPAGPAGSPRVKDDVQLTHPVNQALDAVFALKRALAPLSESDLAMVAIVACSDLIAIYQTIASSYTAFHVACESHETEAKAQS
jgi:hypothetical protein